MNTIVKNDKRTINGWALFDWANSAYILVIGTAIFPVYFTSVTSDTLTFAGMTFTNSALYSFAVTISYLIIALLSPILSGMADYGGRKKYFLKLFTLLGGISCCLLYVFSGSSTVLIGTLAFILANIGFSGGIVFYNAYLPVIASEDQIDKASAKGYAYGYIGSVILLLVILAMVQKPDWFGLTDGGIASRVGFVLVGLWWLGFAQISFKSLPNDQRIKSDNLVSRGYSEIKKVFNDLQSQKDLKRFLWAFFAFSAGIQTIVYVATVFAQKILGFGTSELILIVLIIQVVAVAGAYMSAYLAKVLGNKGSMIVQLVIWLIACMIAYFVSTKAVFYLMACLVGLVLGGLQVVARSSYSKMLKGKEDELTTYFSFYDVLYKLSIVLGTFLFGLVDNITKNMRYSVLVLALFFVIAIIILMKTNIEAAMNASED